MFFIVKEYLITDESALKTMVGYTGHRKPLLNRFNLRGASLRVIFKDSIGKLTGSFVVNTNEINVINIKVNSMQLN